VVDHARQRIGSVAVNVDPVAARTDPQDQAAVSEWLGRSGPWQVFDAQDPGQALRTADSGAPIAGILLAAVLALIILETALARWFSHALPQARPGGAGTALEMAEAAAIAPHS
jgi:fructoselysine-6-P-deglycase FrlB-like protein